MLSGVNLWHEDNQSQIIQTRFQERIRLKFTKNRKKWEKGQTRRTKDSMLIMTKYKKNDLMNGARRGSTAEKRAELGAVGAVISGARRARPQTTTTRTHLGFWRRRDGPYEWWRIDDDDRIWRTPNSIQTSLISNSIMGFLFLNRKSIIWWEWELRGVVGATLHTCILLIFFLFETLLYYYP